MAKQLITATSWNSTEFYWNCDKSTFEQSDMVDIYASDHFECEQVNMESALVQAEIDGLKNVQLIDYPNYG